MDSESTQSTALYDFLGWLDTHRKRIVQVAAGLAVLAVVIGFYVWWSDERETSAAQGLVALQLGATVADRQSSSGESLRRYADEHSSTKAGTHALLLAGGAFFVEDKYAEARMCFEQYLVRTVNNPLTMQASFGIASCLEAEGKPVEALGKYEAVARYNREALADPARLAMARILVGLNRQPEAFKIYQQLGATLVSQASVEARLRAEELLRKYPQLAPTNAPATNPIGVPALPIAALTN